MVSVIPLAEQSVQSLVKCHVLDARNVTGKLLHDEKNIVIIV